MRRARECFQTRGRRGGALRSAAGFLFGLFLTAPPAASALQQALDLEVRSARRSVPELGVHVVELGSGQAVYSLNAEGQFSIASNTKLLTTAAALDGLGPGYFFETRVLVRGSVSSGELHGDLAVVGGGDPSISGRRFSGDSLAIFRRWALALEGLGVRRLTGDIYLVHGLFLPPRVHPDWPRDQLTHWYEAPVEALSFNDNCVLVRVRPAAGRRGGRPQVEVVPDLPLFRIRNSARSTASAREHLVHIDRLPSSAVLTVSGSVYRAAAPVERWIAVDDPLAYFGAALKKGLAEGGVEVTGRVVAVNELPVAGWREVAVHRTDLLTVLEVTNKRSQNFYAESLLKLLGAERCGEGSWEAGLRVVRELLERIGLPEESYRLADGSGMSRNNRFTPEQLTRVLGHMFRHRFGSEYLRSLPYSGEEGLGWEERLDEPPYRGNIFAKTGSLRGISTLSGYAKGVSGRIYAFSILCHRVGVWEGRRAQDRIVRALVDSG